MKSGYTLCITDLAYQDLDEIMQYVSRELGAPNAADRLIDKIISAVHALRNMPYIAPQSRDAKLASEGYRTLVIGKYVAFYIVDENVKQITIHRVLYGKRNLEWVVERSSGEGETH